VVSDAFVAAMRAVALDAGAAEVAYLLAPAHALPPGPQAARPATPGAGPAAPPVPPPVPPAVPAPTAVPGAGAEVAAGAVPAATPRSTLGDGVEVGVLAATRELPGSALLDAVAVMDRLRSPGGCPWDAEQTHASLAAYLLEEAYEAYQALEDGDLDELRAELGDVLMQVLFHARVAAEGADGARWDVDDVAAGLVGKLVRRHPHVFGDVVVGGPDEVVVNWQAIKDAEKAEKAEKAAKAGSAGAAAGAGEAGAGGSSVTDGVPLVQPALSLAAALQERGSRIDLPPELRVDHAGADLQSDIAATASRLAADAGRPPADRRDDVGGLLFAAVALARAADVDPEAALRRVARAYRDRVVEFERHAADRPLL
jgi:XTP/dITP diphosphohydrolase